MKIQGLYKQQIMTIEQIGRYQVITEIGQGGMGAVYSAFDTLLQREVALKLLGTHLGQDETFRQRFQQEAHIVAQLVYAHIVPIYDVGEFENRPYLAMRLLRGGSLREKLAAENMSSKSLLTTLAQVASALDVAHQNRVIHRDIKPTNILFDEQGSAFISDFGIAKILDETSQLTGTSIVGTPGYMSPEHLTGKPVDGRSDQYSLAVVLFEALAGEPLFSGPTMQVMYKHVHETPVLLHEINPTFSIQTSMALAKALSKDPEQRYSSVYEMVTAVQQAMNTQNTDIPLMSPEEIETPVEALSVPKPQDAGSQNYRLQHDYEIGRQAYTTGRWKKAEIALKRVIIQDRYYRDALKLYGEARRHQRQAAAPFSQASENLHHTTTNITPGAGGSPQKKSGNKWLITGGIIALLAIIVLGGLFWRSQNRTVSAQVVEPAPEIVTNEIPLARITVQEASEGAYWEINQTPETLSAEGRIPIYEGGKPVTLFSGQDSLVMTLPDGARVSMSEESALIITAVYGFDNAEETQIQLQNGRVLIRSEHPTRVENLYGVEADLNAGLMGVQIDETTSRFDTDCLQGNCYLKGDLGDETIQLVAGEFSFVGGAGIPTEPEPARFEQYVTMLAAVPTSTLTPTPVSTPDSTATAMSTDTPLPAATKKQKTVTNITIIATEQTTRPAVGATSGSGLPIDFENFGLWVIGDEDKGDFTQSNQQAHTGSYAVRFSYNFDTADNDYVVFMQTNPIAGTPNALKIWVYGDGNGHYLNAWIRDNEGQTWQVPFGKVNHTGWQQMTGYIDNSQDWPWGHISGPNNHEVDYPIQLRGFVLDDAHSDYIGQGAIFLDDLVAATVSSAISDGSQLVATAPSTVVQLATPAAITPSAEETAVAGNSGEVGRIIYTSGNTLLTTDPIWTTPQELGTSAQNSCNNSASLVTGQSFNLYYGNFCGVGEGPSKCIAPNGQYEVLTTGNYSDGFIINVRPTGSTDNGAFVYSGKFDNVEGIRWSPLSDGFLFVVRDSVHFGHLTGGYNEIIPTAYNPVFSPDGSQILYLKPIGPGVNDVFISNSDGTNAQNITNVSTMDKKCAAWIMN